MLTGTGGTVPLIGTIPPDWKQISSFALRQITVHKQIVAEASGKAEAVEDFVQPEARMSVVKDRQL